jgi:hypothetical protein
MRNVFLLLVLALLSGTKCFCQFNDSTHYYLNLTSAGIFNKTNDGNSYVLNNYLRFSTYKKQVSINSTSGFVYGEQKEKLSNRDFTSVLDFDLFKKSRQIYYWGLGNYEHSYSLKIDNRFQAGLGLGYTIVDQKKIIIVVSDGILYEKSELLRTSEGQSLDYETFRNSFRFKMRYSVNDRLTIETTDFLQHALSDQHDYIIRSQSALTVKLIRWVSFTSAITYNKLGRTDRENLLLNFGLTMEKYF